MTTVIDLWITESPGSTLPGFGDPLVLAAESFSRAHPGFEVRVRKVEVHLMPEAVAEAIAQGNPPDVVEYTYSSTQTALDTRAADGSPMFVPIRRAVAGRTEILGERVVIEDLVPTVREYYSVGGELVSVPSMVTTNLLYANKTVLDRAGIGQLPVTWKDLTAACAAVAALPDGPGHGVSWPNYGWVFHQELAGQGALLTDGGNGRTGRATRVFLDSPELLAYVGWWKEMLDSGHYLPTEELHYFTCMQAFARQEIAFVVTSSAVGQMMVGMAAEAGFELTATQLPRPDAQRSPGGPVGGHSLFLTAGLPKEKEDGALAFLQHQLDERHAVARISTPGNPMTSLPITQAAYERTSADDWTDPFPGFRSALAQVTSAEQTPAAAGPMVGSLNSINVVLTEAVADILLRDAEPVARLRAATEEAQQVLDRYNAAALAYPPVTPDDLSAG